MKNESTTVLLVVFSVIGLIHGIISSYFGVFLIWFLIGVVLIFVFNFFENKKKNSSQVASSPRRQRERTHSTIISSPSPSTRIITRTSRTHTQTSRARPSSKRQSTRSRTKATTSTISRTRVIKPNRQGQNGLMKRDLKIYRPKAGVLSTDDFKCIFCFKLPKFPEEKNRGVVLCPSCKFPAHADEFKDWLRKSNLCSRCNAPIPANFKRNPKIISVKNYSIVYRDFVRNWK